MFCRFLDEVLGKQPSNRKKFFPDRKGLLGLCSWFAVVPRQPGGVVEAVVGTVIELRQPGLPVLTCCAFGGQCPRSLVQVQSPAIGAQPPHGVRDSVGLGHLVERHQDTQALCALLRLLEVRQLPESRNDSNGALGVVVVRRHFGVGKEDLKVFSPIHVIDDCLLNGRGVALGFILAVALESATAFGQLRHDRVDMLHERSGVGLTTLQNTGQKRLLAFLRLLFE